jgi:hypothetical protein
MLVTSCGNLVYTPAKVNNGLSQQYCTNHSSIDGVPFFISQVYSDILGRSPDDIEQTLDISLIEELNRTNCGTASPEFSTGDCEWDNNANRVLYFLSTAESISHNGNLYRDSAFLTVLFKVLLRRNPDLPTFDHYLSLLTSGGTRQNVAKSFLQSQEYRKRFACTANGTDNATCNGSSSIDPIPSFVSQLYTDTLSRPPDKKGAALWTSYTSENQLAKCRNSSGTAYSVCDRVIEAQTVLGFLNSSEYLASNPPLSDNQDFVTALYRHLFRREPDPAGLQFQTNYLNETSDRLGTLESLLTSSEYRNRFSCYAGNGDRMNFGVNGHPFNGTAYSDVVGVDYATQISLLRDAGLTWYRVTVGVPASGNDFPSVDRLQVLAQAGGVHLLPIIVPTLDRKTSSLDDLYKQSYSAAFRIVSHFKSSIHVWELSNEEDVYSLYAPGDPWEGGTWPWGSPTGQNIVDFYPPRLAIAEAVVRGLADGARDADPTCLRVVDFAWLHIGMLQQFENDHVPYDIVAIHWYSNADQINHRAMGEITCPGQGLPCTQPLLYFNLLERVKTITHGKPLWITETNYHPLPGNSDELDLALEAEYLPMIVPVYLGSPSTYPFQVVMVYELLDEPEHQPNPASAEMGLYQVNVAGGFTTLGSPKDVYLPLRQIITGH